jgi:hypothetical protein
VNAPRPTKCKSKECGADIYWVITSDKKKMPINAKPDPVGGWVVTLSAKDGELYAEVHVPARHYDRRRYTSHFATCPDAAKWRKEHA